jgi:hypothetical protein
MINSIWSIRKIGECAIVTAILMLGCGSDSKDGDNEECTEDKTRCEDNTVFRCTDGKWMAYDECESRI